MPAHHLDIRATARRGSHVYIAGTAGNWEQWRDGQWIPHPAGFYVTKRHVGPAPRDGRDAPGDGFEH
jgi:hypothetical protein